MMKRICKNCDNYAPFKKMEGKLGWGACPEVEDSFVEGGADDDYGQYLHVKEDFGCIFFVNTEDDEATQALAEYHKKKDVR